MKSYKLPKEVKIRMERELRQYEENKKRLQKLKKTDTTNRYLYLEERLRLVEIAYKRLKPDEQEIYNLIFKKHCNWLYCENMYQISKTTYYNVFNKCIQFLAEEYGEV